MINRNTFYREVMLILLVTLSARLATGQAKLVINGGIITINNGASLVIDNPDNTAIIYNGSGYIKSEGASNKIVWTIGSGNGNIYLVPFGNAAKYLPLYFNAKSGTGANGHFIFSTYPTATWKNSDYLPPGVTNVNSGSADNSAKLIDRFWQINPQGYTTKPSLTNLRFTYSDGEYPGPNTINEAGLIAQRWNNVLKRWDYFPPSAINTVSNTVSISSIAGSQLFDWWTMVNSSSPLPITLVYFKAAVQNKKVITAWQTASEQNSNHFEVWRSRDAVQFDSVGRVTAAGNSTGVLNYTLTDAAPYSHTSYYRLKSVDLNASFKWSPIVSVSIDDATKIFLYPNPVTNNLTISSSIEVVNKKPIARLYDAKGSLLQSFAVTSASQQLATAALRSGAYRINIIYGSETQTLSFIKK